MRYHWRCSSRGMTNRLFRSSSSSIAAWRATGQLTLAAWGYYYLGQVQRAQGRLGAALGTYQEALEVVAGEPGGSAMPAAGIPYVGLAEVSYERGDLDTALHNATHGVALSKQLGWTLPLVTGLTILALGAAACSGTSDSGSSGGPAAQATTTTASQRSSSATLGSSASRLRTWPSMNGRLATTESRPV